MNDLAIPEAVRAVIRSDREWRYGPRGGRGHDIVPSGQRHFEIQDRTLRSTCVAVNPETGHLCGRGIHQPDAPGTGRRYWRHAPRPYGRSGTPRHKSYER